MLNGALKPYLALSTAGHAGLLGILLLTVNGKSAAPPAVYHMLTMSASPGIINRRPAAPRPMTAKEAPAPPKTEIKKPPPQKDPDVFETRPRGPVKPLPRPSFLSSPEPVPKPANLAAEPSISEPPSALAETGGDGPPTSLEAVDMPDFPYSWYVTQMRAAIWDRWTSRMFSGSGTCGIRFTILKTGKAVDIRVEFTSGDKGFDYAALSAIRDAAPFPPLPPGYKEKFLNVHFEFKAR